MHEIELDINDFKVVIGYSTHTDTKLPENKVETDINIESCPQEILDSFGETEIENMIREVLENGRE